MLTFEEILQIIVLLFAFCLSSFAVFCTIYEIYMKEYNNQKNCSISKTQKDIEKRLKNAKKVKLCQKK